ncbi:hypothetical protein HNR42_001963 [Deinobacterium chartae]|uniref:Roadblock/LAMTOR2 domain-containing protein n=1 Tax=Deinobacterium chartae TaxID=521158 RepID=A0A841I2B6_9DEIO|nr:roadblock/LC7 domain-containing protein [Deinobacterium chartae]MBB6098529.1 hypothetical protein [Deinobacterium chartae]
MTAQDILISMRGDLPRLRGSLLATTDGLPIAHDLEEAATYDDQEAETLSAMISALLGLGKRVSGSYDLAPLEAVTVSGAGGLMLLYAVGQRAVLALLVEVNANLGLVHLVARQTAARLEDTIAISS